MKTVLKITLLLLLASCGKNEVVSQLSNGVESFYKGSISMAEEIGRIPRHFGNAALGTSADTDEKVSDLEKQIESLVNSLEAQANLLESSNKDLAANIKKALRIARKANRKANRTKSDLSRLQDYVSDFVNNYSTLLDPCGDAPGNYDEVLLKTYDGTILAFFASSGGFLAELSDGNYVTTDGTGCSFTILNGELL